MIKEDFVVDTRTPEHFESFAYPAFDEEYFEWIDLLESALSSAGEFVFLELGAGFGRWSVNAALAAKTLGKQYRILAVEAEPQHFAWLQENIGLNGLDPGHCRLLWGAAAANDGKAEFYVGNPVHWYGQRLKFESDGLWAKLQRAKGIGLQKVDAFSLRSLLSDFGRVDLVDMDVQGSEFDVLEPSMRELSKKVKRLHIGTHGGEVERDLRKLMLSNSWICSHDYPLSSVSETPFGKIKFGDGVQTWINPSL